MSGVHVGLLKCFLRASGSSWCEELQCSPEHPLRCPGKGHNSLPADGLPSFGAAVCQSHPLSTVSVRCLGCFSSLPGGRTVSAC